MKNFYINETISVKELTEIIGISELDFIKKAFFKGIIIQKNEILKFETVFFLCKNLFNINVLKNNKLHLILKPSINNYFYISITGNVNSGKTTLIDFIFKKNISYNEIGKITQFVSVFKTYLYNKNIFIFDLPGHEIFNKIIKNYINLSNILFLIISVENEIDKVYENILHLTKENNLNIIICLNKIDKNNKNIFIENVKICKISSKNGYGVKKLLIESINSFNSIKNIHLIEENYNGFIVNSYFENNNFIVTLFLLKGVLKLNNFLYFKNEKVFINNIYINNIFKEYCESPCIVKVKNTHFPINFFFSFNKNNTYNNEDIYKENYHNFDNFYIKSDNHTILIAIEDFYNNLKFNNKLNLLKFSLGEFTLSDFKYCLNFNCKIILINIKLNLFIKKQIIKNNIFYKEFDLINNVIDFFNNEYHCNKIEIITGELEVKSIFPCGKNKKIAGCYVKYGYLEIENIIKVYKELKLIFQGKINSLKIQDKNVIKVLQNDECGINIKNFNDIETGLKIVSIKYVFK
ncbi:GTP-binding protein [Candidatus Carsonella ruddii]|uniref:GTP-binding protein n=1 Tax=Carsonella ruddii TaxID=114186 RepID=UPI003D9A9E00